MSAGGQFNELMPIVAGPISWPAGDGPTSLQIELGDRTVDLEGYGVAAVIAACDGRSTVSELIGQFGDEAGELIEGLLGVGALVDGAEAWRVFHRQSSAGTALGSGASEAEILELQQRRWRPAHATANVTIKQAEGPLAALVSSRSSMTAETPIEVPNFENLCALLSTAFPAKPPSAGGLYPVMAHVVLREPIGPLNSGTWWVDAGKQELVQTTGSVTHEQAGALFIREPGCDALLERGGPLIFLSTDLERPQQKYGARAYRFGLIEVGAAMQSASLSAAELGIPLRVFGGIDDRALGAFLQLPEHAVPLLGMIVG